MPVPNITPLPPPPSRGQAPASFVADADAFFDALPDFVDEVNAAGDEIDASVTAAAASADAALAAATATTVGTSTTSVAIGTGSKVFTTQAGKNWIVGTWLVIPSAANPANFMTGQVTAYSGTSLTVNVTAVGGSGTFADWNIGLAGARGAQGAAGVNGNGAWTQIGSTVNTTSGSSVTFSSIPDGYSDILFEISGVSPSGLTANLQVEFSDDGTNWTTPTNIGTGSTAADTHFGQLFIPRYRSAQFGLLNGSSNITTTRGVQGVSGTAVRLAGVLTHVRFSLNSGNFDAGTIRLFGRLQA
jgi:hypothetical protein